MKDLKLPNVNKIYKLLIQIPLYKSRSREEVFLGIKKSKYPKWNGWNFLYQLKRENKFPQDIMSCGLYELAVNFWLLYSLEKPLTLEFLESQYEF